MNLIDRMNFHDWTSIKTRAMVKLKLCLRNSPHLLSYFMFSIDEIQKEPLPGYRLVEPIGRGGFGHVWKCEAPGGLFKAIKFVYGNLNGLADDAARAQEELRAIEHMKSIRHPFLLSIERVENIDGQLIILMELADKSLYDLFL